jgi:retinol-binding protein 3
MNRIISGPRHLIAVAIIAVATAVAAHGQMGPPADFSITAEERTAVIERAITRLNENYVFPETARKMEAAIRSRLAKKEYAAITSARQLAEKLTADLQEVSRDKHLRVMYSEKGFPGDRPSGAPPSTEELDQARQNLKKVNFGFEKVERLRGNVGYVDIRGFVPAEIGATTATAAMNFVANADYLIVDLRRNNGGEPAMIAYILSYLFDQPTHLNDIYERPRNLTQQWWTMPHVPGPKFGGSKPVYVLTSRNSFSGAEEFANNIKTQKRGTIIGETTGGGAHPTQSFRLGERFAIGVPFARAINPITGSNWEGTGVAPDVPVPADDALDVAYRMILEEMLGRSTDDREKQQIQNLLNSIGTKG